MSNNSNEQTQHETRLMNEILTKIQISSEFEKPPSPYPDFVLGDSAIGVELTHYVKSTENIEREKFVKNLVRDMESDCKKACIVYLYFSSYALKIFGNRKYRSEQNKIKTHIAQFVEHKDAGSFNSSQLPEGLSRALSLIQIFDRDPDEKLSPGGCSAKWQWVRAGFINLDPQTLQDRITDKEKRLAQYKDKYHENWLIIHSSSGCVVGLEDNDNTFATCAKYDGRTKLKSDFDRVIFYDCHGKIHDIKG